MAKATANKKVVETLQGYTLELTPEEATFLYLLVGYYGGDMKLSAHKYSDSIFSALSGVVKINGGIVSFSTLLQGNNWFNNCSAELVEKMTKR